MCTRLLVWMLLLLLLSGGQGSSQQACRCIEVELSMMKALQVGM